MAAMKVHYQHPTEYGSSDYAQCGRDLRGSMLYRTRSRAIITMDPEKVTCKGCAKHLPTDRAGVRRLQALAEQLEAEFAKR